ncbi:MAG TPA: tetratricopeptide repeat protein [Bryobacteraceae bacterium]|nr:tetratricopeptide repeat protein [Bryobacteraceae bacterium]
MKHTLCKYTFRTVVLGLALSCTLVMAQKRDDILSIQRDVAQLQDQVKQLQAGQDQKIATLESLIKQALEESGQVSSAAAALQRTLADRLNEQQSRVEAPIAALGSKVDQSGDDLRAARENLADLGRRMANLDNKLADISSAVRTLSTTAVAPPPPGASVSAATSAPAASSAPPGVTADSLWKKAVRDYTGARDKQALSEFADFTKYFPQDTNAAEAQYYMGLIYDHGEQYDDAAQVFEAVTERYPDSPKAADAMYMKGVEYQKAKSDKKAIAAYRAFLKQYPNHANAAKARARLRTLAASGGTPAKKRK